MKVKAYWSIGLLFVFIAFLIAKLPAQQVLGRVDLGPNISLQQVSGTLWNGRVGRASIKGIPIDNFKWQLSPLALLVGNISAQINGGNMRDVDAVAIKGEISLSLFDFQPIRTDDLLLFLPTNRILALVELPVPVNAGGRFRLRFEALDFGPDCTTMTGFGDWLNASVEGTNGLISLDTFSAKLSCEDNQIVMQVNEPNMLGLSFVSRLTPDFKEFALEGRFKPDAALPREVHQAAQFFGAPGNDGYIAINL